MPIANCTTRFLCQALADLLIVRCLILKAVKAYRQLPDKRKGTDPAQALLLELEPQFYLWFAIILMSRSFGKPETKLGELDYRSLGELIKEDMAQNTQSKR